MKRSVWRGALLAGGLLGAVVAPGVARAQLTLTVDYVDPPPGNAQDMTGPLKRVPARDGEGTFYVVNLEITADPNPPPRPFEQRNQPAAAPAKADSGWPGARGPGSFGGVRAHLDGDPARRTAAATARQPIKDADPWRARATAVPSARGAIVVPPRGAPREKVGGHDATVGPERPEANLGVGAYTVSLDVRTTPSWPVEVRHAAGAATPWSQPGSGEPLKTGTVVLGQVIGRRATWTHQVAVWVPMGFQGDLSLEITARASAFSAMADFVSQ